MLFLRALLAFLVLPVFFCLILPPILTYFDPRSGDGWSVGLVFIAFGLAVIVWCARDFYVAGKGTVAPWDPPKRLVAVGLYRFTRNPIYIGDLLLVAGWAVVTGSHYVAWYLVILAIGFHLRVISYEEPWLEKNFPSEWASYSANVSRWLPRLRPWADPHI
ncbi:MAG: methyltransferase family protein [Desulfomonilaceae bacterium]